MRTPRDVALDLATAHRKADPGTSTIKYFQTPSTHEVRLLEVSSTAPTTGQVLPFGFGADRKNGIDYPSVVILVSPAEWQSIQTNKLLLPSGWDLSSAEDL